MTKTKLFSKRILTSALGLWYTLLVFAQDQSLPSYFDPLLIKDHVYYLASDELQGRNTGEPGNIKAADYIASTFDRIGIEKLPGRNAYLQDIKMQMVVPGEAQIAIQDHIFKQNDNLLSLNGAFITVEAPAVFIGFGDEETQYADVKDKVVLAWLGSSEDRNLYKAIGLSPTKRSWAEKAGAIALVEVYNLAMPWSILKGYLGQPRMVTQSRASTFFHALIHAQNEEMQREIKEVNGIMVKVSSVGMHTSAINANNVLGIIPGTDAKLKEEYILLSAHFDHVGVKKGVAENQDSIYNGTRDNAIGTAAILAAAGYFKNHPSKRSIILAAWNGEEKGLLGSKYFIENPWIPLSKIKFNLNIDNAGYTDTSLVSIIGLERTGAAIEIKEACGRFRLLAVGDPAPEQNLFDRSDNVNFAQIGIPAPTFSLGFTAFDQEISRYYHQTADNPDTVDYGYLNRYWSAFILAAENIANRPTSPKWKPGDKYEEAAKVLYGDFD